MKQDIYNHRMLYMSHKMGHINKLAATSQTNRRHKMEDKIKPNIAETEFLTLSYNRFYDIFDEVMKDEFWDKQTYTRFSYLKDGFSIYAELLKYEPFKQVIENLKTARPPMEAEIGSELFKFFRNVISHFPFFTFWDEVYITKTLVNWEGKPSQTIDKFLEKYKGKQQVKYRFWEADKKRMTYLSINFPTHYQNDFKIYLKDILSEKEGVKFSFILMKQIMDTQVDSSK